MLTVDALAQEIRRVDGNHSLGAGALAEALMPFISAALSIEQTQPVQVKALEWAGETDSYALAEVTQKTYSISFEEGAFWANWDASLSPFSSLSAAKSAAQQDYETRIRSAIVGVAAVEPEPVAWMYQFKTNAPVLVVEKRNWAGTHSEWTETPLYAHPPTTRIADSAEAGGSATSSIVGVPVEPDFWTSHNNFENLTMLGKGVTDEKDGVVWDFATQEWVNADVPLYATPPSTRIADRAEQGGSARTTSGAYPGGNHDT